MTLPPLDQQAVASSTTYAVALSNTTLPAAAWYSLFYLYFVFALAERKNEIQKEGKVPHYL